MVNSGSSPSAAGPSDPTQASVDALDQTAVELIGVRAAGEAIAGVGPRRFLHAGPPIDLADVPGPIEGALIGALLLEGEAATADEARRIIARGELEIGSAHDSGAASAMAGVVSPSTAVVVASAAGRTICSPLNEGLGTALRFGNFDSATLGRLKWMNEVGGPLLDKAVRASDPIDLAGLVAEGLRRGDECHNRNVATSALLMTRLAPGIAEAAKSGAEAAELFRFGAANKHFFLPFSIVTGKGLTSAAHGVDGSPIVTAMAGNGREFGIRVSGTGERWFTTASPLGDIRYFDGFTAADATPTMGDSMITETAGFGAFATIAAPAIASFIGGTAASGRELVEEMRTLCAGTSTRFLLPAEDHAGTPIGIDVRRVVRAGAGPLINNGVAHRDAGRGQVGAGVTRIPLDPFVAAARELDGELVTG